jgi:hypothetical protein
VVENKRNKICKNFLTENQQLDYDKYMEANTNTTSATARAQAILEQLGGGWFLSMTGASGLIAHRDGLSFCLPKDPGFVRDGIDYVMVRLDPGDTYTVEFSRVRRGKVVAVSSHDGIYADQITALFESQTGLATSFMR